MWPPLDIRMSDEAPSPLQLFARKADTAESMREAVAEAAGVCTGLWLSYLFVLLYLLVAIASVTQKDLLLENRVQLPFLSDISLPLQGFFCLCPMLFCIIHMYILLHFSLFAGKLGDFRRKLRGVRPVRRSIIERQLPNSVFVHLLAGPQEVQKSLVLWLLKAIAWISLVIGPILLLLFFQLQFLSFHNQAITWVQRIVLLLDLGLIWYLWPNLVHGERIGRKLCWRHLHTTVATAILTVISVLISFAVATSSDEWLQTTKLEGDLQRLYLIPKLRQILVGAVVDGATGGKYYIDWVSGKPLSLWTDRIVLPNLDVIDSAAANAGSQPGLAKSTYSFRERDLAGAIFSNDVFQNVSFVGADLTGAMFNNADLRGSDFGCQSEVELAAEISLVVTEPAQGPGSRYSAASALKHFAGALGRRKCTRLRDASFVNALLQGTNFSGTDLHGVMFNFAHLEAATLDDADITGAQFDYAVLEDASLLVADTTGARLDRARLAGARLNGPMRRLAKTDDALFDRPISDADRLQPQKYDDEKVNLLISIGCASDGGPYVIRDLMVHLFIPGMFLQRGDEPHRLATAFLDPTCQGRNGLTDAELARLQAIEKGNAQ